jgi:OMF family outer membrane factor
MMRLARPILAVCLAGVATSLSAAPEPNRQPPPDGRTPTYTVEQGVALAGTQNPELVIARKRVEAARGDLLSARAGYLPSVISNGLYDKREHQNATRLRDEDYNAVVRAQENVYTGGATSNQVAIAHLNIEKQECELRETENRVSMDVRIAFYELLLNRAKVKVRQDSVGVLEQELKSQKERFDAGLVGTINVLRAEVALASERPELANAQTQLKNSYLRLGELFGLDFRTDPVNPLFEVEGQLQYQGTQPDLNACLARADVSRPTVVEREKDVEIEDHQYRVDRSELLPHVETFSAYEVYNERDPDVGREFNHGYLVGVDATWHLFDGFATKGKMQATRARREAAVQALRAARLSVASEVRSAFLDLQQADTVLQSETKNVQTADETLEIAKANTGAGLGTQLDVLQAASDVTRTRTTRLSAIYLHNAALARLARACATAPDALDFGTANANKAQKKRGEAQAVGLTNPPEKLTGR